MEASGIISDRYRTPNGVLVQLSKAQIQRALRKYYGTHDIFVSEDKEGRYKEDAFGIRMRVPSIEESPEANWWCGRLSLYEDVIELEDGNTYQSGRQPFGCVAPLSCVQIERQKIEHRFLVWQKPDWSGGHDICFCCYDSDQKNEALENAEEISKKDFCYVLSTDAREGDVFYAHKEPFHEEPYDIPVPVCTEDAEYTLA